MSFAPLANTVSISAGPTITVANIATNTNTFRFLNANVTGYSYVGVFSDYATAAAAHHPPTGGSGALVPIGPTWPEVITGNFGTTADTTTVYIAAITAVSSGQIVFATPIRPTA
jgi:hypothetical protein